jgi:hypothetical protein
MTKGPLLSRIVIRPGTKGVFIYKSSDPPSLALGDFFIPDPPPLSSSCPPPLSPSSSPTAAFRGTPRPLHLGILRHCRPPGIRRPPTRRRPLPRHAGGPPPSAPGTWVAPGLLLPDLPPPPPGLLLPILLASASSPSSSAPSSPASEAPPSPHAARLAAMYACVSSPPLAHQHRRLVLLPLPSATRLSSPMPVGAHPSPRLPAYTSPARWPPKFNWVLLTQTN